MNVQQALVLGIIIGFTLATAVMLWRNREDRKDLEHYRSLFAQVYDFGDMDVKRSRKGEFTGRHVKQPRQGERHLHVVERQPDFDPPIPDFLKDPADVERDLRNQVSIDELLQDWGGR